MPRDTTLELFTPFFETLTDPRVERGRHHPLPSVIVLALCGTLAGADGWAEIERYGRAKLDFFRRFLDLPHGIPSHDTFGRVFARLKPDALRGCIRRWLAALGNAVAGEVVAIDGKTLRGSFDAAAGQSPLHLVSAFATDARLVLGQVAVDGKSNEITAIPLLVELLDLKGAVVTIDAMGCQTKIAAAIRRAEADYVLAVKDNQPTLHATLIDAFVAHAEADYADPSLRRWVTVGRGHGRDERREYFCAPVPAAVTATGLWADVSSIGMVLRTRTVAGQTSEELSYFISSLPPKVKTFAKAVRDHWGIENRVNWILDVTFAEDKSRIRSDHGPENLAMFRRLALSILQNDSTVKDSLKGKRQRAGWDDEFLLDLITAFPED
jgi:predicted transposase YbfD/YdcC